MTICAFIKKQWFGIKTKLKRLKPIMGIVGWSSEEVLLAQLINDYRRFHPMDPLINTTSTFILERLIPEQQLYKIASDRNDFIKDYKPTKGKHPSIVEITSKALNLGFKGIGENLGFYYRTPKACFNGWLESKAHHRIMINPYWKYVAISIIAHPETGRKTYVALFSK